MLDLLADQVLKGLYTNLGEVIEALNFEQFDPLPEMSIHQRLLHGDSVRGVPCRSVYLVELLS